MKVTYVLCLDHLRTGASLIYFVLNIRQSASRFVRVLLVKMYHGP
jgi:hypothetical protein